MNGADPNIKQFHDGNNLHMSLKSCLHLAVERGQIDMVQLLIEFNADIFAKDANGFTPMDLAEQGHYQDIVERLKCALVDYENKRDDLYKSLAIAVHKGDTESVKKLLELADNYSIYGLKQDELFDVDIDDMKAMSIVNYAPNGSNTLLFKACQEGHLEIVKHLINAGADGRQHPITKYSPLYIAAYHGRLQICQILLNHFSELSTIYTVEHWLPVHAATINNHQEIVQLLLTYKYSRNVMKRYFTHFSIETVHSVTRLSTERKNSKAKQMTNDCDKQFLYLMPFDLNAQDIAGQSILYLATLVGNQSLVEFLLNFRLKTIPYALYIEHFENKLTENFDIDAEYSLLYEFDEVDDLSDTDSDSSIDITVIGTVDSTISSQKQPIGTTVNSSQSTIKSSIQNLIRKFSPSSSPCKTHYSTQTEAESNFLKKNKRIFFNKSDLQIYEINPLNIDLYCNYNMETALHCAVKKRHYSIASLLLENGADPNLPINGKIGTHSSIVTRVTHFNHNLFAPQITSSLKEFKRASIDKDSPKNTSSTSSSSISILETEKSDKESFDQDSRFRSTCLREAIRNRDKNMVDLLLRFGSRDDIDMNETDECTETVPESMSALMIAFHNMDFHFVSKLLSLKAFVDVEFKINKKSFDIAGSNCMNALNKYTLCTC